MPTILKLLQQIQFAGERNAFKTEKQNHKKTNSESCNCSMVKQDLFMPNKEQANQNSNISEKTK